MNDPHPAPQWYTPSGSTPSAPGAGGYGAPTAPIPVQQGGQPQFGGPQGPTPPTPGKGSSSPSGRRRVAELSAVAVLAALLSSGGTIAAAQLWDGGSQTPSAASSQQLGRGSDAAPVLQADASAPNWSATASAVSPSVVSITASTAQGGGQGSGVIIDDKGHVLTNNHVVAGAQKLTVTLPDGRTFDAAVQGTDPSTDLAVVTISNAPSGLKPIAIGDSDALKVGDPVMAIGNPLGLAGTVTTGIVSALNRPTTTQGEGGGQADPFGNQSGAQAEPVVTNAIQTSAAINPGNSGGALVNASGQLIGINSSIASLGSSSGGQSGSIGIGFAIPANEAASIATQLIETGSASHAYLGVTPEDGSATEGSASRSGAKITSVGEGTPASQAGLKVGDVITAVDGEQVDSALSLVGQIRERTTGQKVTLTVIRDGASTQVEATLTAKPDQNG